jgi:hypothetical protein
MRKQGAGEDTRESAPEGAPEKMFKEKRDRKL